MLKIENLYKKYKKSYVLKDINLDIKANNSLALIGESGAGKTTLCKLILGLEKPTKGQISLNRKNISVVFQDYRSSVNPFFKIKEVLNEPFWIKKTNYDKKEIEYFLEKFHLSYSMLDKYPHELSGGQLQRICTIRALLSKPNFIVLDEAFSAIDASTKNKIIKVLKELKKQRNLTFLLISHDLQIATALCDEIKILHKQTIIESLKANSLKKAKEEYTKKLIDSVITVRI